MHHPIRGQSLTFTIAALVLLACLATLLPSRSAGKPAPSEQVMTPTKKAEALGIKFEKLEPGYLNRCVKSGKLLFTSGHTSKIKGRLGKDLKVEDGDKAARECDDRSAPRRLEHARHARQPARRQGARLRQLGAGLHRSARRSSTAARISCTRSSGPAPTAGTPAARSASRRCRATLPSRLR